ncbi:MAG: DUF3426 domain-containing protein [Gammaproteobacteria bacterium]|nr:MAG: DUF3426 domain-containing protein [Gammaproteobacteria bacterium]
MYTKCPECRAVFRVTTEQLHMAEGLVRCGICDSVFNGSDHIEKDHNPNATTPEPWHPENNQDFNDDPWPSDDTNTEAGDAEALEFEQQSDDDALTDAERIPTVIRDDFGGNILTKTNSPIQIAVFTLGAIGLALFFLGQINYWQNIEILPRVWVNGFCNTVGCGENNQRDLNAIKILNRNIYTHPNVKEALMITTSFVNQGRLAQAYPLLEITLLDTHGKIVAVRRFSPKDYLVNKSLADTLMPTDQPVGARLEVLDPGNKVIAYEFEFH